MIATIEGLRSPVKPAKPIRMMREHLYIEPISVCNLKCKMCYANVINGAARRILDQEVVLSFAERFMAVTPGQAWVLWCGIGEIFLHRDFPAMVNHLMAEFPDSRLKHTVQTTAPCAAGGSSTQLSAWMCACLLMAGANSMNGIAA